MEKIVTKSAPAAIGPYSQGIAVGELLFTSGQIALDPETGAVTEGGIEAQTERVCENIRAILLAGGASPETVIKTTCFLTDMGYFAAFNAVYSKYFPSAPARSCVAVAALPKGVKVEVEAIAKRR